MKDIANNQVTGGKGVACALYAVDRAVKRVVASMPTFCISPGTYVNGTVFLVSPSINDEESEEGSSVVWVRNVKINTREQHAMKGTYKRHAPKDDVWRCTIPGTPPKEGDVVDIYTAYRSYTVAFTNEYVTLTPALYWRDVAPKKVKPRGLSASEQRKLAIEASQAADEREHAREYA